jgi:hypothetical protein
MAMQRNYFTVLFFLKKSKLLKNGEAPICMRITINGKRAEVQIKRSIDVTKWNTQKECAIGREKKYQEINHYLDTIRTKILQIHRELEQDGKPITADIIKNIYYGEHSTPKMLLEVFQEHNSEYRELMNKEYAEGTVLRYERTARYLKEFISEQYKLADIPLKSINYEFITKFEHFIKIQKNCAQNATVKYLKNLKKIIKTALIKKWITDDPFAEIHFKQTKCNREFLNEMELRKIINKDFDIQRLQTVRDIFIFCCFPVCRFDGVYIGAHSRTAFTEMKKDGFVIRPLFSDFLHSVSILSCQRDNRLFSGLVLHEVCYCTFTYLLSNFFSHILLFKLDMTGSVEPVFQFLTGPAVLCQ